MAENILGSTKYYKRNINGTDVYSSIPWGGNVPYGYQPLSSQEYVSGLQNAIKLQAETGYEGMKFDPNVLQQRISEVQGGQGVNAPGYTSPEFAKFNPTGQPTEANFTEAEKARVAGIPNNLGGGAAPTTLPLNRANTIGSPSTYTTPTELGNLPTAFAERMNLAGQAGITNYTGTPQQNAQIQAFQAKQQTIPTGTGTTPTGQNLAIKGTLQQGSSDVQVGNLQKTLNEVAQAGLVVDNNFGPKTKQAVMAFQQANGLVADGIVGPKTLAKIQELQGQKTQQQNTVNTAVNTSLTQSGISPEALEQKFATNPTGTIQEIVNQVSQTAGLSQLNTQIQNLTQQQKELADKKVQELNEITNNPWISESLKQRKIGNLDSKYQGLEQNIQSALQIATNQLGNAEEQVRYVTTQAINQYNTQQTLDETRSQNAIENSLALAKLQQDKTAGGLTPAQINTTVNSIAGAFDNEQTVKDYNVIKRQVQVFNSLGESATDDIQRVYAFAKIADPTSAVKEGEYNSIEKYSQALLQRVGLKVSRVFLATGILTPEARTAMSTTIQKSLDAAKTSYDQVYNEYQRQIQDAYSGKPRQITQYTTPEVKYVPGEVVKNSEEPKTFLDNLLSIFGAK